MSTEVPLYRICVTGGPCAGKTTAMAELKEKLTAKGFKVFIVPEVPTLTMNGGGMIIMEGLKQENVCRFQGLLMQAQINLEDYFIKLAKLAGKPSVILMDRGVLDPRAYMDAPTWQSVLDENDWNVVSLRDKRYDAVIHLITAADGARDFYTLENNAARYEDAATACVIDSNTQKAWTGHPHHIIIDNSCENFQAKIEQTVNAVERFIGLPVTNLYFRKWLVKEHVLPEGAEQFQVEEHFLRTPEQNEFEKIRRRGQNGSYSYLHTVRVASEDATMRKEIKRLISAREYLILKERIDENIAPIRKTRSTFLYKNQTFILEHIEGSKHTFLRVESAKKEQDVHIPDFITIDKEITNQKEYNTFNLAKK